MDGFEACFGFGVRDPFSPWHPSDRKDSESKWPADCPFALSLRSKPKGPVFTVLLSRGPHTYSESIRTICVASSDCWSALTSTNCIFIPPLLDSTTLYYKICRESHQLEGFLDECVVWWAGWPSPVSGLKWTFCAEKLKLLIEEVV